MGFSLDKAFAVPAAALKVQSERTQVLSENIANADTPNYKARDIDFRQALRHAGEQQRAGMLTTNARHIRPAGQGVGNPAVQYRVPMSPSLDGNTVEMEQEQARFAQSTVNYQAALNLLGGRIQKLVGAIKGE
ncbi:MAG: flagellar basal body rod protein FlgB [Ectothiorhodospiraceae bacterium]|jgi:flagellar basal-body rod protein FlgB